MSDDDSLSQVLREFARTLLSEFSIQEILDLLVLRIVDTLPIDGAGVTLIAPGLAPYYVAASNDAALAFERLQTETGEGPCRLAYDTGEPVLVADLAAEFNSSRFPEFARAAAGHGLVAVFAFPLHHGEGRIGSLDLYRSSAGPLEGADLVSAQTLADVTSAYVGNAQARDAARVASDRFREISLTDPLTGLANRLLLRQRLDHAAHRARRTRTNAAVLFADLDRFKQINDTYGHEVGDQLLVAVARRLTGLLRAGDTLARVSGDEFVFLCEDLQVAADVDGLAVRINDALTEAFTIAGLRLNVSASVGIAYAGPGEEITDQLIIDADIAMYQAKRNGGAGHQILDLRHAQQIADRVTLDQDLHAALEDDQLNLVYQPIVHTTDSAITGVEALLRWTHPGKGPIPAELLVSIAEDNGLIVGIGDWVLRRACAQRARWLETYPDHPLTVAVNVSARQLLAPGFVATVTDTLQDTRTDAAALVLEMTEAALLRDSQRAAIVLTDLRHLGVQLALDDFGTGYSSLTYLRELPVDIIKIDRSFTAASIDDATTDAIIDSLIGLADTLGLMSIAEGVETLEQHERLISHGCTYAQGFLYGAPMSAVEIDDQLAARHRQHASGRSG